MPSQKQAFAVFLAEGLHDALVVIWQKIIEDLGNYVCKEIVKHVLNKNLVQCILTRRRAPVHRIHLAYSLSTMQTRLLPPCRQRPQIAALIQT